MRGSQHDIESYRGSKKYLEAQYTRGKNKDLTFLKLKLPSGPRLPKQITEADTLDTVRPLRR